MKSVSGRYFSFLLFFSIVLWLPASWAQTGGTIQDVMDGEAKLLRIIHRMQSAGIEEQNRLNDSLQEHMEDVLRMHAAFNYPFDSLKGIAIVTVPSNNLRIFTWELPAIDGQVHYYGFITAPNCDRFCEVQRLHETRKPETITEYSRHGIQDWPGALYYDMKEVDWKKSKYYVLLGINRNSELTKKKFIEVLTVEDSITFGREVFSFDGNTRYKRRIYEYAVEADMSVFFESDERLVMDHLSPENPNYKGKFQYYVPDFSFDALELKKGIWIYKPDVDAREHRNLKDRYYDMKLPEQQKIY